MFCFLRQWAEILENVAPVWQWAYSRTQGSPRSPREPRGGPREAPGSPREPQGSPREPRGGPREAPGSPREPQGSPREAPGKPREPLGGARASGGPDSAAAGPPEAQVLLLQLVLGTLFKN